MYVALVLAATTNRESRLASRSGSFSIFDILIPWPRWVIRFSFITFPWRTRIGCEPSWDCLRCLKGERSDHGSYSPSQATRLYLGRAAGSDWRDRSLNGAVASGRAEGSRIGQPHEVRQQLETNRLGFAQSSR